MPLPVATGIFGYRVKWFQRIFLMASSWLQSTNTWRLATQRLRRYGFILGDFLTGILADGKASTELLQGIEEKENRVRSLRKLEEVESIIGYSFNNRSLLHQAFTHSSYTGGCPSYERLEYVGDSVLNLLITKLHFSMYPDLPPGLLTPLRAANVDTEKLARVSVKHNFHKYLRHTKPHLRKQIDLFIDALPEYPLHSHGLIDAPKVLADVVESTIGAVYVDSNSSVDATWKVAKDLLEPLITLDMLQTNPVKKLLEICQKNKLEVRLVDLWSREGIYEVFVDNKLRGRGQCHAKKEIALNRAANDAYNKVAKILGA